MHIGVFVANAFLLSSSIFYKATFILQVAFYLLAGLGKVTGSKNKILYFPRYYTMMMLAQLLGAKNELTGKSKATWEKAESTRQ